MATKKAYIVSTPSGRSVISVQDDPVKALNKTKAGAAKRLKTFQKHFKVKLKVKKVSVPCSRYNKIF